MDTSTGSTVAVEMKRQNEDKGCALRVSPVRSGAKTGRTKMSRSLLPRLPPPTPSALDSGRFPGNPLPPFYALGGSSQLIELLISVAQTAYHASSEAIDQREWKADGIGQAGVECAPGPPQHWCS